MSPLEHTRVVIQTVRREWRLVVFQEAFVRTTHRNTMNGVRHKVFLNKEHNTTVHGSDVLAFDKHTRLGCLKDAGLNRGNGNRSGPVDETGQVSHVERCFEKRTEQCGGRRARRWTVRCGLERRKRRASRVGLTNHRRRQTGEKRVLCRPGEIGGWVKRTIGGNDCCKRVLSGAPSKTTVLIREQKGPLHKPTAEGCGFTTHHQTSPYRVIPTSLVRLGRRDSPAR